MLARPAMPLPMAIEGARTAGGGGGRVALFLREHQDQRPSGEVKRMLLEQFLSDAAICALQGQSRSTQLRRPALVEAPHVGGDRELSVSKRSKSTRGKATSSRGGLAIARNYQTMGIFQKMQKSRHPRRLSPAAGGESKGNLCGHVPLRSTI